jgi:hypothetical protein
LALAVRWAHRQQIAYVRVTTALPYAALQLKELALFGNAFFQPVPRAVFVCSQPPPTTFSPDRQVATRGTLAEEVPVAVRIVHEAIPDGPCGP